MSGCSARWAGQCVCVCVCMCVRVLTYVSLFVSPFVGVFICVCLRVFTCVSFSVSLCRGFHMCVYVRCSHVCVCLYRGVQMCECSHMCLCVCVTLWNINLPTSIVLLTHQLDYKTLTGKEATIFPVYDKLLDATCQEGQKHL